MAEETSTKIFDVEVNASGALKSLAELRLRAQELKDEQKALGKVTEENAEEYYALDNQIKALNAQANKQQKTIQDTIKLQNSQEKSLEQLRAKLALENAEFVKLGQTENNYVRQSELAKSIADTTEELKRREAELGQFYRNVGDYAQAGRSLNQELRATVQELQQLALQGDTTSEAYINLRNKAADLRDTQTNLNAELSLFSNSSQQIDQVSNSIDNVVKAFVAWQAVSSLVGKENEQATKIMKQLLTITVALNAASVIYNNLQKTSTSYVSAYNIVRAVGINQSAAENKALAAKNVLMAKGNILTKAAAAVTYLWNAALAANPVVLVVAAIASLVGGISLAINYFKNLTGSADKSATALATVQAQTEKTTKALQDLARERTAELASIEQAGREEIQSLQKVGAARERIAAAQRRIAKQTSETQISYFKQENEILLAQSRALSNTKSGLEQKLTLVKKSSKEYKEWSKTLKEVNDRIQENTDKVTANSVAIKNAALDIIDSEINLNKELANLRLQRYLNESKAQEDALVASLKLQNTYQTSNIVSRQKYEAELFQIQQKGAQDRLEAQKKYGTLTAKEYSSQLAALEAQEKQFRANQLNALNNYYRSVQDTVTKQAGASVESQISELILEYNKALKSLDKIEPPIRIEGMSDEEFNASLKKYEEFLYNRAEIEYRLQQQFSEGVTAIREKGLEEERKRINTILEREYKNDLEKFNDNESEKLKIQEEKLKKQIELYRAAGLSTANLDSELNATLLRQQQITLNSELIAADKSNKKRYEARKKYLEAELALVKGNAVEEQRINAELADAWEEYTQQQINSIADYADKVSEIFSGITDIIAASSDRQLEKVKAQYEQQNAELDKSYARGNLTQAQYTQKQNELARKQAKDEAKINREKAVKERTAKAFSIATDTLVGISSAVAASPLTSGLPWSAFVASLGAINLVKLLAEPLPKAAKGAFISGPTHANGGVQIEAEGGEAIINSRSTSMFLPLLSAINELGGGVPFVSPYSDGGFALRTLGGQAQNTDQNNMILSALENIKVVATIEDIRDAETRYIDIEQAGTF